MGSKSEDKKRVAAIMALVDEYASAKMHAINNADSTHAAQYCYQVREEIERSLQLAALVRAEDFATAAACLRNRAEETRRDGLASQARKLDRIADDFSVVALCIKVEQ